MSYYVPVQKFGRTPDIDAIDTNEEIWDGTGVYGGFLDAAAAMKISSSSTDDTSAGSGARTVKVVGLNSSWEEVEQTVTLSGQTGVSIPTSLIRVYRAHVVTVGSGDVNAGDIWIGVGTITDGVPATKYAGILTGLGQTLMAVYTVPVTTSSDKVVIKGVIRRWYATTGAAQAAYATVALQTRAFGSGWRTRRIMGVSEGAMLVDNLLYGIDCDSKTDIRIRAISNGVNNSTIEAGFDLEMQI